MEEGRAAVPVLEREADEAPEAVPLAVDEPDWAETEPEADAEEIDAERVDEPETETEPELEPETGDDRVREEIPVREVDPVAAVTLPVAEVRVLEPVDEVRMLEPVLLRVLELLVRDVPVLERELELDTREEELVLEEELLVLRREVDEVLPVLLEPALLPQLPNLD